MMVDRELTRLQEEFPDNEIIRIDIVARPLYAWQSNIRMIPALKAGTTVLSGIILGRERIRNFLMTVTKE